MKYLFPWTTAYFDQEASTRSGIALATLGVVGAASAQVAISGSIAVGVQNTHKDSKAKFHLTDADINFSGTEDLGGGLSVSAGTSISMENLRAGGGTNPYDPGDQQGVTANNTTLAISGGFGSLSYGNVLAGPVKMGDVSAETDMNDFLGGYGTYNKVEYMSPDIGGGWKVFYYWLALDNTGYASSGTANSQDLEAAGSGTIGATGSMGGASIYVHNNTADSAKGWDLRVGYDLGVAKVNARTTRDKYTEFNVSMPMGAMTLGILTANHKTSAGTDQVSGFKVDYAMSKQTTLSFNYASGKNVSAKNAATAVAAPFSGNNYRLNLVKKF